MLFSWNRPARLVFGPKERGPLVAVVCCRTTRLGKAAFGQGPKGGAARVLVERLEGNEVVLSDGHDIDGEVDDEMKALDAIHVTRPGGVDGDTNLGGRYRRSTRWRS